ncbi:MAG: hypothetical protein OHK0038_01610 [Flammeovirgaceae bacterium]
MVKKINCHELSVIGHFLEIMYDIDTVYLEIEAKKLAQACEYLCQ